MPTHDLVVAVVGADLRTWPRPPADLVPEAQRAAYVARSEALTGVVGGMTFRSAAIEYHVDRRTVARDAAKALEIGPDGKPLGFRACLPYRHRMPRLEKTRPNVPPDFKGAYAFARLLAAVEPANVLVSSYKGSLPTGKAKCRSFDRHAAAFRMAVRAANGETGYPFTLADQGRRALLNFHKRLRIKRLEAGAAEVEATAPSIRRFDQLFQLAPLDRLEYDGHKVDVDWELEIARPDGRIVKRRIQCVTLLALICAVSRYLVGIVPVLGTYNRLDVLRLFNRALTPWRPRALVVPNMVYPAGARLGFPADAQGAAARGVLFAGDNALAHHAHVTVNNFMQHHRGIFNLGKAHIPEIRPIIESFFRLLEEGALRNIAGGFQPETRTSGLKVKTSYLRASDHPFQWTGILDLIDVIGSGYNVTPHSGLHDRTPLSAVDAHLANGWFWQSTESDRDAQGLSTQRISVTLRGDQSVGRHPYIQYHDARYRSHRLMGRWDLVGRRFFAEVNLEDLRHLVLLDQGDGTPWSRLSALPPWDRSPHDLHLRQQIIRARNRGLLDIAGAQDAIAAFHEFARSQALQGSAPPDLYARVGAQITQHSGASEGSSSVPIVPRGGRISFARTKD